MDRGLDGNRFTVDSSSTMKHISSKSYALLAALPLAYLAIFYFYPLIKIFTVSFIPDEAWGPGNLKKLVTLDLTGCFLTGTLPQSFGSSSLVSLLLASNAISGRFSCEGDSPHLQSIQEIRMENNLLTGTLHGPTLSRMTELVSLSLSYNDLSGLMLATLLFQECCMTFDNV